MEERTVGNTTPWLGTAGACNCRKAACWPAFRQGAGPRARVSRWRLAPCFWARTGSLDYDAVGRPSSVPSARQPGCRARGRQGQARSFAPSASLTAPARDASSAAQAGTRKRAVQPNQKQTSDENTDASSPFGAGRPWFPDPSDPQSEADTSRATKTRQVDALRTGRGRGDAPILDERERRGRPGPAGAQGGTGLDPPRGAAHSVLAVGVRRTLRRRATSSTNEGEEASAA